MTQCCTISKTKNKELSSTEFALKPSSNGLIKLKVVPSLNGHRVPLLDMEATYAL